MTDLQEAIKAILDKDCLDNLNGKCNKCLIYTGKYNNPDELGKSFNLCWLCHEHENLAREICDAVEFRSIPRKV